MKIRKMTAKLGAMKKKKKNNEHRRLFPDRIRHDNCQTFLFALSVRFHIELQQWMCDVAKRF
jgi:hypothetical protein